jgi:hypothetical protein
MEDANVRQHAADEQMRAAQDERRRHDDRLRELLDVATKLINQTAKKPEARPRSVAQPLCGPSRISLRARRAAIGTAPATEPPPP